MPKHPGVFCRKCRGKLFPDDEPDQEYFESYSNCRCCGARTSGKNAHYCARCGILKRACCGCGASREAELKGLRAERRREEESRLKAVRSRRDRRDRIIPVRELEAAKGRERKKGQGRNGQKGRRKDRTRSGLQSPASRRGFWMPPPPSGLLH